MATPGRADMNCDGLKSSILNWFGSEEIECKPTGENSLIASFPLSTSQEMGMLSEIGISPVEGGGTLPAVLTLAKRIPCSI